MHFIKTVLSLACIPLLTSCGVAAPEPVESAPVQSEESTYDDTLYEQVLKATVDGDGYVNYTELAIHREPLDRYIVQLKELDKSVFDAWPKADQQALWMNAYNSLTLKLIIDHYPIKKNWKASLLYDNGIRHISGAWDDFKSEIMGTSFSLNEIEHEIIRKTYKDARVHMALVCAALSCPRLLNEPYRGPLLDEQFTRQTKHFLSQKRSFHIDRAAKVLNLSSVFKWFGDDFVPQYGKNTESALRSFISQHIAEEDQALATNSEYSIKYLSYDWGLNDIKNKK